MTAPLSAVMPVYNEEGAIEAAVREVQEHVLDAVPGAELIVVDDGSRDATGAILDRLARTDGRLQVIHQPNGGHGAALRTGLGRAAGTFVFLLDSDRQIPLTAFDALWQAARSRDGAFGVRLVRHDPRLRLVLTRVVRATLRLGFGVQLADANVPFKIVRRTAWLAAESTIPAGTLAPSLFLAVFMRQRGYDVAEVAVPHRARATGTISIRRWKLLRFCMRALGQLVAFRVRLRGTAAAPHLADAVVP